MTYNYQSPTFIQNLIEKYMIWYFFTGLGMQFSRSTSSESDFFVLKESSTSMFFFFAWLIFALLSGMPISIAMEILLFIYILFQLLYGFSCQLCIPTYNPQRLMTQSCRMMIFNFSISSPQAAFFCSHVKLYGCKNVRLCYCMLLSVYSSMFFPVPFRWDREDSLNLIGLVLGNKLHSSFFIFRFRHQLLVAIHVDRRQLKGDVFVRVHHQWSSVILKQLDLVVFLIDVSPSQTCVNVCPSTVWREMNWTFKAQVWEMYYFPLIQIRYIFKLSDWSEFWLEWFKILVKQSRVFRIIPVASR